MYSIYADDVCIYNDQLSSVAEKIISPKLTLSDNAAGSLEMTIPTTNENYDLIQQLVTDIQVYRDATLFWEGRVISEKKGFYNDRILYCEGALAYLNDTTQLHYELPDAIKTPEGFLRRLLWFHNRWVDENRQIQLGAVTVSDPSNLVDYRTNYGKTIEYVNAMVKVLGGHLRIRYQDGDRYLDYLAEYPNTSTQTIEFGKNLLEDYTCSWDQTEFATVIVPLGVRIESEEEDTNDFEDYLTVKDATEGDGTVYVKSSEAIANYGWIEKKIEFSEIDDPDELYSLAVDYLQNVQFDDVVIELSAVDLHYLDSSYAAFNLLDRVHVISVPHGMDRYFPVTKIEIMLDTPENTKYKLGDKIATTLTSVNNQINENLLREIEESSSSVLTQAKANANQILNMATNGYITIVQNDDGEYHSESLIISDAPVYQEDFEHSLVTSYWKWNVNGLGYWEKRNGVFVFDPNHPNSPDELKFAITKDGSIVANHITVGTLTIADSLKIQTKARKDGSYLFQVDQYGLTIQNSSLTMKGKNRYIYLDPEIGFAIGKSALSFSDNWPPVLSPGTKNPREEGWYEKNGNTYVKTTDTSVESGKTYYERTKTPSSTANALAWLDSNGNLHLSGTLEAATGTFSGTLSAQTVRTMNFDASQITTGTLNVDRVYLYGNMTVHSDQQGSTGGTFGYTSGSYASGYGMKMSSGGNDVVVTNYGAYIGNGTSRFVIAGNPSVRYGSYSFGFSDYGFFSQTDYGASGLDCGLSGRPWNDIWAENFQTASSDANKKKDIESLPNQYDALFDLLRPVRFRFIDGTSGRYHVGLIAQEVATAMTQCGIPTIDFAGYVKDVFEDDTGQKTDYYGLRYGEFLSIIINRVQKHENRIANLERLLTGGTT